MKFSCMMELNKYPLDVQVCTMEVASCKLFPVSVMAALNANSLTGSNSFPRVRLINNIQQTKK